MAALWALVGGLFLFYVAVPSGLDHRYLLPVLPPALVLAALVLKQCLGRRWPRAVGPAIMIFVTMVVAETWRPVVKHYTGASEVISELLKQGAGDESTVLIVSDVSGEGAMTAAAAFLGEKALRVLRGSKILASSDWLGRGYELKFSSREDLRILLEERGVDFIVLEQLPDDRDSIPAHWSSLAEFLSVPDEVDWASPPQTFGSERKHGRESEFVVYQLKALAKAEIEPQPPGAETDDQPQ